MVIHTHSATEKTTRTEVTTYSYDEKDRISKITHKLGNNAEVTLVTYTYDAYGRVTEKIFHNANSVQYQYNLRNWVTSITATKFQQNLYYNTGNGASCYNGNISSTTWKSGNDAILRGYKFTYDGANRMTGGTYGEGTAISSNVDRFSESATYDKNGNIVTLQRRGQTGTYAYAQLDNLTYTYNGNHVTKIEDAATAVALSGNTAFINGTSTSNEYTYDANGNITKDLNKGIGNIKYNLLNLPEEVAFTNGDSIKFFYSAEGEKLKVEYVIGGTTTNTCYCANVVYENNNQKYLLNDEGYYDLDGINGGYHYYLKDHLGNNRVIINQSGAVQQTNHYYPYGGTFASSTNGSNTQPYKYNGKEYDTHAGLNWYDYGARHYDPAIARWTTQDPLAEKYYGWNQYNYCTNNPIKFVDPNGKNIYRYDRKTGDILLFKNTEDDFDQIGRFKYDKKTKEYVLRTDRKGRPKMHINNIEKGILSNKANFLEFSQVWSTNVVSVEGFQNFIIQFSDMIGKEMAGYYYTDITTGEISFIHMGRGKSNSYNESFTTPGIYNVRPDLLGTLSVHTNWHTHPSSANNRNTPSHTDYEFKNNQIKNGIKHFIILTRGYPPIHF